ncbi:MAG: RNase H family protein [Planctomycetota bacterium]
MQNTGSHFLLLSEAAPCGERASLWRFVLEDLASDERLSAWDEEPNESPERAELLSVVRGLEALDGPARVTLVTTSRYVWRGLQSGLGQWREGDFHWEHFGRRVPVKDHDLWRRLDRAMQIHAVECRPFRCETNQRTAESEPAKDRQPLCNEAGDATPPAAAQEPQDKCSPRTGRRSAAATPSEGLAARRRRTPQRRQDRPERSKRLTGAAVAKQFLHGAAALMAPLLPHSL